METLNSTQILVKICFSSLSSRLLIVKRIRNIFVLKIKADTSLHKDEITREDNISLPTQTPSGDDEQKMGEEKIL